MKHFFAIAFICFFTMNISAQNKSQKSDVVKIAYYNIDSVLSRMPEFLAAGDSMWRFYQKLELKMAELNMDSSRLEEEISNNKLSKEGLELKKMELEELKIQRKNYIISAQESFVAYKAELLKPIFEKIDAAAQKIAKEKGYIFLPGENNSDNSGIPNSKTYDIFKDMCKELGIPVSKKKK